VPHVEQIGQWEEFNNLITDLNRKNTNPKNYSFTVEIWHAYTGHDKYDCNGDYVYRYWIYQRATPKIETVGTFQVLLNSIKNYPDRTIRFTKSTYISGNKPAYQQVIYSANDDEPYFVGLSTIRFPRDYEKPIDLSLNLYNNVF